MSPELSGPSDVMSPSSLKRKRAPSPQPVEDSPVLSHAAKRKQKRALLNEPTTVSKNQKEKEGVSTPVKRQNSIWVGNLSYKTTQESLRRFFDGVGEITRVHLPTKPGKAPPGESASPENRGFAYVDFATLEAKNAAIVMTESPLDGRRLLIKDGACTLTTLTVLHHNSLLLGNDFEGRPPNTGMPGDGAVTHQSPFARKILSMQKQPPAATVFFGNLGFNTTVDSIRGLLEAHRTQPTNAPDPAGEAVGVGVGVAAQQDPWIRKIRMGTFEDSGLCKGFAFVDFTSTEHATAALVHPKNHHLDGRKLVVEYASADAVRRGGGASSRLNKVSSPVVTAGMAHHERRELVVGNRRERKGHLETTVPSPVPRDNKSIDSGRRSGASSKVDKGTRKARPAPGAALALAKREQVAIVPSQGRRITFDD
ncbi:hypothetical protein EDB87DRAFT_246544 [Lactarius vividus]|nr:hypothetical protein EDB87DRAFT_246544 [Lactarius vividus]